MKSLSVAILAQEFSLALALNGVAGPGYRLVHDHVVKLDEATFTDTIG